MVRKPMAVPPRVKSILAVAGLGLVAAADNQPPPDPQEILRAVRVAQSSQSWNLLGQLRVGNRKHPFRLVLENRSIRYEFLDDGDSIALRLGEAGSTLEERKGGAAAKVTAARFNSPVRDTDISYEDLSLRFLYWKDARVVGAESIVAHKCWKVEVRPPSAGESQYDRVMLWVGQDDGALMKAEGFDSRGNWLRRFTVRSVMKRDGYWLLKQMRIERSAGRVEDLRPTYLEIDEVEK
jgi:hypothetical protein